MLTLPPFAKPLFRRLLPAAALVLLAGCAAPIPSGISDPYEAQNRAVHRGNVALDRSVVRPTSMVYGRTVPGPVRTGISNVASNLSLPAAVVNSLLQLRPGDAAQNTTRFLINTTIGLGGLLDPATPMGATQIETGFGETLHVWGVAEGNYVELPLIGPSTGRDAVGTVVDVALSPTVVLLRAERLRAAVGTGILSQLGRRFDRSNLVDPLLYESADSYAQSRQIYLDNRRFRLRRGADPDYFDPYEDPYDDPAAQ
ncbi:MlaA family lipoprotein [Rhodovulum steppense]|uniref:Phospholipid-binding lipoprotein MlaA n=1 Tax=Rhodovulum steppense TaxID=540251 RepID=A0A4R1YTE4_9RHOB|nr:VacJ family lipoprotein [Rhodovulum steppense]TCM83569.1 phospholipid-binding lipoprotein MlaA [Rhodovulum steppense]